MSGLLFPKPEKRSTTKGRKKRLEIKTAKTVRAECVLRDGYCRFSRDRSNMNDAELGCVVSPRQIGCVGPSEWAHLWKKTRARTVGMAPEDRHTTTDSVMLCRAMHRLLDAGRLVIEAKSARGADGPLRYRFNR